MCIFYTFRHTYTYAHTIGGQSQDPCHYCRDYSQPRHYGQDFDRKRGRAKCCGCQLEHSSDGCSDEGTRTCIPFWLSAPDLSHLSPTYSISLCFLILFIPALRSSPHIARMHRYTYATNAMNEWMYGLYVVLGCLCLLMCSGSVSYVPEECVHLMRVFVLIDWCVYHANNRSEHWSTEFNTRDDVESKPANQFAVPIKSCSTPQHICLHIGGDLQGIDWRECRRQCHIEQHDISPHVVMHTRVITYMQTARIIYLMCTTACMCIYLWISEDV